jgi:hypothetical protein
LFPFASDERFSAAEALEDLFPNPPQSQKRRFTRWLSGCWLCVSVFQHVVGVLDLAHASRMA